MTKDDVLRLCLQRIEDSLESPGPHEPEWSKDDRALASVIRDALNASEPSEHLLALRSALEVVAKDPGVPARVKSVAELALTAKGAQAPGDDWSNAHFDYSAVHGLLPASNMKGCDCNHGRQYHFTDGAGIVRCHFALECGCTFRLERRNVPPAKALLATKRKPRQFTDAQRRIILAVGAMQRYVATYTDQEGYRDYSEDTFINDMLYGIGLALDRNKYACAHGFEAFKDELRKRLAPRAALENEQSQPEPREQPWVLTIEQRRHLNALLRRYGHARVRKSVYGTIDALHDCDAAERAIDKYVNSVLQPELTPPLLPKAGHLFTAASDGNPNVCVICRFSKAQHAPEHFAPEPGAPK